MQFHKKSLRLLAGIKKVTITLIVVLVMTMCEVSPPAPEQTFANDMFLPHEGIPAGIPNGYSWKLEPVIQQGNDMPEGWKLIIPWGQIYADETQPTPDVVYPDARVHLKNLRLYIYHHDGSWEMIHDIASPIGFSFVEDFAGDKHKLADIRNEKGGGISTKAGSGFNFHFFPADAKPVNGNDIAGVFVVCEARLIGAEVYETPPKYLLSVGGDYWRDDGLSWAPENANNIGIAIGRFKYVTPEWQYFTMHTFTQEEVENITFPIQ